MNKQELINAVAEQAGLSKADAKKALNGVLEVISSSLAKGNEVSLIGFGTFAAKQRAARVGRNPATGKEITISATKVPTFRAGKGLKDACGSPG